MPEPITPPIPPVSGPAAMPGHGPMDIQLTVFDLGKHKTKAIKKLRRGNGKLVDVIRESLSELHASGADMSQPVVFVCERKSKIKSRLMF
jgi:hypothetical protein